MKLTESRIKEIIKEEMQKLLEDETEEPKKKLGQVSTSSSVRAKDLKQGAADVTKQQGIDPKEYGIMKQFEELIQELANITDIKTGKTIAVLNPVFKKLTALLDQMKKQAKK
tara:strand:+ start:65 stop:400 length:336 start_codon:yes stop_codon:yes gene_type:complete